MSLITQNEIGKYNIFEVLFLVFAQLNNASWVIMEVARLVEKLVWKLFCFLYQLSVSFYHDIWHVAISR